VTNIENALHLLDGRFFVVIVGAVPYFLSLSLGEYGGFLNAEDAKVSQRAQKEYQMKEKKEPKI
jgi:hypothetical protein